MADLCCGEGMLAKPTFCSTIVLLVEDVSTDVLER